MNLKSLCAVLAIMLTCMLTTLASPVFPEEASLGSGQDLRVVASDDHGLTLELVPPPLKTEEVQGPNGKYTRLEVPGWSRTTLTGYPELPTRGVLIQVPQAGAVTVEVLDNPSQSLSVPLICPVPRLSLSKNGNSISELVQDDTAYGAPGFYPSRVVELSSRDVLRGTGVVRVMFQPFQWDPATGELRCSQKIRIAVHFEDPLFPAADDDVYGKAAVHGVNDVFETSVKGSIVNYRKQPEPPRPTASPQSLTSAVLKKASLRLEVKQDGIYRVTCEDMRAAGVTQPTIYPSTLRMYNKGNEIAIRVVLKTKGQWQPGDYVEFYAQGISNLFTDSNVYWLCWGNQAGKRAPYLNGSVTGQGTPAASFYSTLHAEENHLIWGNTPGAPEEDYWTWEKIIAPGYVSHSLDVPSFVTDAGEAVVKVCFRGNTTAAPHPNHHTQIFLNGTMIGDERWDGSIEHIQEMHVSPALLVEGANSLFISAPGDTGAPADIVYLNWIGIDYWRRFEALWNELSFKVQGNGRLSMEITKLGRPDITIYDVTDPCSVKKVVRFQVVPDATTYKAVFEDVVTGEKEYRVMTGDRIRKPDLVELWRPKDLRNPAHAADYILVTAREFLPAIRPLVKFRRAQGLRVKAVAMEDIYNEFSDGLPDPQALKDFLKCAYETWTRPAPTYVFLLGDASYDYKNYLGTGKKNRVPVHLSWTDVLGITADDNWYVAVEGQEILPAMLIGRTSANTVQNASEIVQKILGYEQLTGYQPQKALFVADNNETFFETLNEALITTLPAGFEARKVYLKSYSSVSYATSDIISNINEGMLLTNYVGHGDVTHWAGESLFIPQYVPLLSNADKLTFILTLDCLNGFFAQPYRYSISDEFVIAPDKGAIAAFSPTGLGYNWEHQLIANEVFSAIFKEGTSLLGPITIQSKIDAYGKGATLDSVKTFTLLGDPAVRLKIGN